MSSLQTHSNLNSIIIIAESSRKRRCVKSLYSNIIMSDESNVLMCANCGKGEEYSGDLKSCAACKLVKYCSRDCQIAHRPQHKRACKKRTAELYDEKLFKPPPPREECPICMLPLPLDACQVVYQSVVGRIYAMVVFMLCVKLELRT